MTTVGSSTSTSQTNTTTDTNQVAMDKLTSDYTTFLKLLTTQLQNQDPTNPMDSAQFTQQLVMYSQVEQQIKSNQKLDTIISNQNTSGLSSWLNYLGRTIEINNSDVNFDGTNSPSINYTPSDVAREVSIKIYNSDGTLIRTISDQSGALGKHTYTWDGENDDGNKVAAGVYTFAVAATDSTGKAVTTKLTTNGKVDGVESNSTGDLVLDVGKLQVSLDKVIGIHDTTVASSN